MSETITNRFVEWESEYVKNDGNPGSPDYTYNDMLAAYEAGVGERKVLMDEHQQMSETLTQIEALQQES